MTAAVEQRPLFLTPPEVGRRWGVAPETVLGLIARGQLRAVSFSPATAKRRFWKIHITAIEQFEATQMNATSEPPRPRRRRRETTERRYF